MKNLNYKVINTTNNLYRYKNDKTYFLDFILS